jgi:hypothetical protein
MLLRDVFVLVLSAGVLVGLSGTSSAGGRGRRGERDEFLERKNREEKEAEVVRVEGVRVGGGERGLEGVRVGGVGLDEDWEKTLRAPGHLPSEIREKKRKGSAEIR